MIKLTGKFSLCILLYVHACNTYMYMHVATLAIINAPQYLLQGRLPSLWNRGGSILKMSLASSCEEHSTK